MKKSKHYKISTLKNRLWNLVKTYIRKKHGNVCYTCRRDNLESYNWHTGHYIPSAICPFELDYDERNLRPQCYNCNINLGGNGGMFGERLKDEFGQEYVSELWRIQKNPLIKKPTVFDYFEMINRYKRKLKKLEKLEKLEKVKKIKKIK